MPRQHRPTRARSVQADLFGMEGVRGDWWRERGRRDRALGNTQPAVTVEDFLREIEDAVTARAFYAAYMSGWEEAT